MQDTMAVDWNDMSFLDVLPVVVASFPEQLGAMRQVCSPWKYAIEQSVTKLKIQGYLPALDAAFWERFPKLINLDLRGIQGDSPALAILPTMLTSLRLKLWSRLTQSSLDVLHSLSLSELGLSFATYSPNSLKDLQQYPLPITSLDFSLCDVTDASMEALRGMPLQALGLRQSFVTEEGLKALEGKPLTSLDLCGCSRLAGAGALTPLVGMYLYTLIVSWLVLARSARSWVCNSLLGRNSESASLEHPSCSSKGGQTPPQLTYPLPMRNFVRIESVSYRAQSTIQSTIPQFPVCGSSGCDFFRRIVFLLSTQTWYSSVPHLLYA